MPRLPEKCPHPREVFKNGEKTSLVGLNQVNNPIFKKYHL